MNGRVSQRSARNKALDRALSKDFGLESNTAPSSTTQVSPCKPSYLQQPRLQSASLETRPQSSELYHPF